MVFVERTDSCNNHLPYLSRALQFQGSFGEVTGLSIIDAGHISRERALGPRPQGVGSMGLQGIGEAVSV